MPTFLQLHPILSVYSLLKPPRFGNCEVIEEKPGLDFSEFRKIFQRAYDDPSHFEQLKAKLDGLVETGDWDLDNIVQDSQTSSEVVDAILYYITGFLARKMKTMLPCELCRKSLSAATPTFPQASLTICKSRDTKISIAVNGSSLQLSWEAPCQSLCSSLWWCHLHEGSLPGDCTLEAVVHGKDNEFATASLFIAATQKESKVTGNIPRNHLFSCELSASRTSVLENELKTCRELHDLEPLNKWPLLTCVLLMRALDGCKFRMDIKKFLTKLTAVDPMRRNYYNDLNSKFAAESVIEQLGENDRTANFSGQCLTSIRHTDHLALLHEIDFSRNQIKSTLPLGCLLSIRKLILDDNCIESCEGLGSLNTLTILSLRKNRICNKDCLIVLKTCLMLTELNLEGNPIPKCKDHVEVLLPQVKFLDAFLLSS
ncbi:hypothetical protein MRX96_037082 [Rhipicephalus microplus]